MCPCVRAPSGGFKIAWNINRLETHSFSSSRCLSSLPGVEVGAAEPLLEDLENISNEVFLGLANSRCLAAFPRSGRPRCVGRKKRAVVFQLRILQGPGPGPHHPLVPKERSLQGDKEPTGKGLVPTTFLLTEQTSSQHNSTQQSFLEQLPLCQTLWATQGGQTQGLEELSPGVQEMYELAV